MRLIITNKKNIQLAVIGLFLFSCVVYSQTLFYDFIWDDQGTILFNKNIETPTAAVKTFYRQSKQNYNVAEFEVMTKLTSKNWRPLRTVAHSLIFQIFNRDPFGYHLANIIMHALVVVLLLILLLQLVKDLMAALVGALLFAVHPVNSEVVCWAKSLEDLLATCFLLLTFNLILRLNPNKKHRYNITFTLLAALTFALALVSKLSVIFFPLFLLLFILLQNFSHFPALFDSAYWQQPIKQLKKIFKLNRWALLIALVLVFETIGAIIARSLVLEKVAQGTYITGDCWTTWLSMPRIFLRYLQVELFPYPLYADYMNYPGANSLSDLVAWSYALAFLVIFIGLSWLLVKKKLVAPWLWFWCGLLPFTNIIAMDQLGAERFLYIPTIGLAWLVAEIFKHYSQPQSIPATNNKNEKILLAVTMVVILVFLTLTIQRSAIWNNRLIFWLTATEQFPHSQRARRNLIKAYIAFKQPAKAVPYVKGLIKDYPQQKNITLYAHIMYLTGNSSQVIKALYKHKDSGSLNYIAIVATKYQAYADAEQAASLAYQLLPDKENYDTLNRVALSAAKWGEFAVAERCLFLATAIAKNDNTVNRVGISAAQQGKLNVAERCFKLAAKLAPDNKKYLKNLALLQRQRQNTVR